MSTLEERFLAKVVKTDGCWKWIGATTSSGYGCIGLGRRRKLQAHRVSYELYVGEIPEGRMVLHRCDNPPCCNPDHLFIGTQTDNMRDAARKGRNIAQKQPEVIVR